jgi:hypothetical protein
MQNSKKPTDMKIKAINAITLKRHSEKNTIKKEFKRNYSVSQYFTNNEIIKEKLISIYPNFETVINDKYEELIDYDCEIRKITFYYDKEFRTKKMLNLELLKFLINLIYYQEDKPDGYYKELDNIFYLSYHLISRGFRCPFKIFTHNSFKCEVIDIRNLYNFVTKNTYNDIFVTDEYTVKKNIGSCCVCLEDYEQDDIYIKCNCTIELCINCFDNLDYPKRCPICRYNHIHKATQLVRNISFKYNNQTKNLNVMKSADDELIKLIFYNIDKKEIEEHYYYLKTDEDLREEFYEDIEDRAIYYNSSFIHDNMIDIYKGIVDEGMIKNFQEYESYETIARLLGFINSNLTEMEIRQNKRKFFNKAVSIEDEGMKHVCNLEYYKGVCDNTNRRTEYNITSNNNYLDDTLFKEEEGIFLKNFDFMNDFMEASF